MITSAPDGTLYVGQTRVLAQHVGSQFPDAMPNAGVIHHVEHHDDPISGDRVFAWIREE